MSSRSATISSAATTAKPFGVTTARYPRRVQLDDATRAPAFGDVDFGVQALDLSFRLRLDAVLPLLDLAPGSCVLDVGGGVGAFSAALAARLLRVTCADAAPENVEVVRRRYPTVEAVEADAADLPFADGSFDAAVCMEVLEHIEDDGRALREIRRVLRRDGRLIVTVPNADAPPPLLERIPAASVHAQEGPERHYRAGYRADALARIVRESGFAVDSVTSTGRRGYRTAAGLVSLAHLVVRRVHGDRAWTWADVDADAGSFALRVYGVMFPAFLAVARAGAAQEGTKAATLVLRARAS